MKHARAKRFFVSCRHLFELCTHHSGFSDFDLGTTEESDKVEIYRFLETGSYDFHENRFVRATFDALSSPLIKISEKTGNPAIIGFRTLPC